MPATVKPTSRATSISPTLPQPPQYRLRVRQPLLGSKQLRHGARSVSELPLHDILVRAGHLEGQPHLTLDLGVRSPGSSRFTTRRRCGLLQRLHLQRFQCVRLYRPICVGASTCSSGQPPTGPSTGRFGYSHAGQHPAGYYVGKWCRRRQHQRGTQLVSAGYPNGASPRGDSTAPRLGFAYDLTGSHRTVVRALRSLHRPYESGITGFGASNPPIVLQPRFSTAICPNPAGGAAFCRR